MTYTRTYPRQSPEIPLQYDGNAFPATDDDASLPSAVSEQHKSVAAPSLPEVPSAKADEDVTPAKKEETEDPFFSSDFFLSVLLLSLPVSEESDLLSLLLLSVLLF
ncbi:MAG: hypothetical protein MJ078_07130 [Clostridia bacterium]|nr:hypothetical protein [Clostridia bacterium]